MTTKLLSRLRADHGSAAASMVFALLATLLIGVIVTVTVSLAQVTAAVTANSSMNSAVDARYDQYVREVRSGQPVSTGSVKYSSSNTEVAVTSVNSVAGVTTITLHAIYANGASSKDVTRSLAAGNVITGFDSSNQPVWG